MHRYLIIEISLDDRIVQFSLKITSNSLPQLISTLDASSHHSLFLEPIRHGNTIPLDQ